MDSPARKQFAAMVVKSMPKPSSRVGQGYESGIKQEDSGPAGRDDKAMIADEMLTAIHSRDADALSDALCAFMKLYEAGSEEAESSESEPSGTVSP